jgi:hypothetical protein
MADNDELRYPSLHPSSSSCLFVKPCE